METQTKVRSYKEAVEINVKWWSEKTFNTPMNQNNGDDSPSGGLTFLLGNMLAEKAKSKTTPAHIAKFEEKLTELLLTKEGKHKLHTSLDVDYHPNELLREACIYAEVNTDCLPIKTFTRITDKNQVEGRYQYGGDWFLL